MSFYEFLQASTNSFDSSLSKYANSLLGFISTMAKFPKVNKDRKTVEYSLKRAMGDTFDAYQFEYAWKAYEYFKFYGTKK